MSKVAEILLGKEKAQERQDTLSQLESSIEKGDRPKAKTFLKKLLNFEAQLGKSVVSGGMKFYEAEKAKVERERAERARSPYQTAPVYPQVETSEEPAFGSVFSPLTREKDQKAQSRMRVDSIIRELEDLKRVI